jgi:glycine/D-amino acid oxidase-like deaminating enzyme
MTRARPVGTLAVSPCVHGTGDSREDGLVSSTYEHIVLGAGGIGAAAAYWLARRGGSVLALEQYRLGHDRGASEDHSRIIRHSYHTTEYTSLTRAAYDHVRDLRRRRAGRDRQLCPCAGRAGAHLRGDGRRRGAQPLAAVAGRG